MSLVVHGDVPADRLPAIHAFLAEHHSTERVFRDVDREGHRYDLVAMDEYTIDLLVALGDVTLVYDTT